jgi:hypothetical protein
MNLNMFVINPIQNFLDTEISLWKESGKSVAQVSSKYSSVLEKRAVLPSNSPKYSNVTGELKLSKIEYCSGLMDHTIKVKELKSKKDTEICEGVFE